MDQPGVWNLVWSIIIILAALILSRVLRRIIPLYIEEPARRFRTAKIIGRVVWLTALVAVILVWSGEGSGILTVLTLIGAGLAIALRELLLSFAAWINIVARPPYKQGDRIEVNDVRGDVLDIGPLHTVMLEIGSWVDADQSTGRIAHVPNNWIFLYGVHNYTRGFSFIWNEISFTVTFRSDWTAAREIMIAIANENAEKAATQARQQIESASSSYPAALQCPHAVCLRPRHGERRQSHA
jgi:small-conductance mechanosensitive channel